MQFSVEPARVSLPASLYIVGVPMAPADGDLRNVFRKPGTNQPANFQTAAYTGKAGAPYVYGPAAPFPAMKPGDGFWLRAVEPIQAVASGRAVDHGKEFAIKVQPGWQLIANPFLARLTGRLFSSAPAPSG